MRKFLIPLLVLVSTPAFSQNADLSIPRMNELGKNAMYICRAARTGEAENMGKNVVALSGARTLEEKIFILYLCKMYIDSKIEDAQGRT